jgi:hypothetical protein
VEVPVWSLPLPGGEQLELVAVPAGETTIGSPAEEASRDVYPQIEVGAFYWTAVAPDIVNPGREEQGSASV